MIATFCPQVLGSNASAPRADRVIVYKSKHKMELLKDGKVIRTYQVALGGQPVGPKRQQGDHKTPEGTYVLDRRNAHSSFYKSLHVSYPNAHDRAEARKLGVAPGGDIMVHGLPPRWAKIGAAHRAVDWTDGCIAVTDEEMDQIWQIVPDGTPIEIRP